MKKPVSPTGRLELSPLPLTLVRGGAAPSLGPGNPVPEPRSNAERAQADEAVQALDANPYA